MQKKKRSLYVKKKMNKFMFVLIYFDIGFKYFLHLKWLSQIEKKNPLNFLKEKVVINILHRFKCNKNHISKVKEIFKGFKFLMNTVKLSF